MTAVSVRAARPILIVAGVLLAILLPFYVADLTTTFHIDFVAFWCAGRVTLAHQSPYLESPLHACEVAHGLIPTLTVPVPYPPHVLAFFAAMALIPEPASFAVWSAILIAATALSTGALRRLTGLPWPIVTAANLLVLVDSIVLGQGFPIALCGLALALLFIRDRRQYAAAAALAVASLAPTTALAAWVAAFAFVPRIRLPLVATGAALLGIGLFAGGPDALRLYVGTVLPAHGASEIGAFFQLGSAAVLHSMGVPQPWISPIAYVIFVAAVSLGIAFGVRLRALYGGDHWIVACAAAFAVIGAPFAHGKDLGFALPLAFMLFAAAPANRWSAAALALVAIPWQFLVQDGGIQAAIALPLLLVVFDTVTGSRLVPTVVLSCAVAAGALALYRFTDPATIQLEAARSLPTDPLPARALAEERWSALSDASDSSEAAWASRLPTYVAYVGLIVATVRLSRKKSATA